MANTKQAAKRARKSVKQRSHNVSMRSELRTAIKKIHTAVATGDAKAARHKSRLAARIKALSGARS